MHTISRMLVLGALGGAIWARPSAGQGANVDVQIAAAVTPLPAGERAGATVYGYPAGPGLAEVIREGTNQFVCLADRPGDLRFQVSCYHRSLDPFMQRGRELRAQGITGQDVWDQRGQEVETGSLVLPERALLYTLRSGQIDSQSGLPDSVTVLRVLYVPYATVESTGWPAASDDGPYLMNPGMHRAHLMMPGGRLPFSLAGDGAGGR